MHRLLYERTGTAVWISHLDMVRMFQRCFARAGIRVKHTAGFNPHAYISIALPLSVGVESECEILDFTLEDDSVTLPELPARLNACFPEGLRVLRAYESDRKIRDLTHLRARLTLTYDNGMRSSELKALREFYASGELVVLKRRKKGDPVPTDLRPMIVSLDLTQPDEKTVVMETTVCAQNPSLNPEYLLTALREAHPDLSPDDAHIRRLDVLDASLCAFR